ncbi:hypothetical protein HPB50_013857 [Hyalomma asiaticum]|uniref:Uncharacterized protein n=1 Tax=Hyalomma asiaticum TaxID=266040 RepID=A0ACB7RMM3_HYAAI|nr:hypothetical protein HPB50_013857 [Hyalomma asiaticum]
MATRRIIVATLEEQRAAPLLALEQLGAIMEVVGYRRTPNRISLDDMPCEILINICSYLDYQDLIRCSRLSRRLRDVCAHDPHWRGLCWKYWLETELPEGATWRSHFQELYRDLRRYVHCYAAMKSAWQKIKTFMQKHCPVIAQSIKGNAGATEHELDQAEGKLGVRLPDDLRCCYRIHNGQRLASPGLMGSMSIPTHYRSESLLDLETAAAGFQAQGRDGLGGCMPLTFCLHSGLTQFIALHDSDGHAPGCVFYPSQDLTQGVRGHPLDAFITARSFGEWFTGYADMLANEEFVVLDNQPYRMSMSEDASDRESCQLETRHWIITDENGLEERVDGRGVVGEYPVMSPGAYFSWVSCTSLSTTFGNMKGHFVMRNLHTGDMTEVHCPVFNMKCLPYVTSAEREAIKRQRDAIKKEQ